MVAARMGFGANEVAHLGAAEQQGLLPHPDEVRLIDAGPVRPHAFRLRRTFWSYPALAAFHSRRLTELVYLSRFSDAIHRAMYLIRPRAVGTELTAEIASE